VWHISIPSSKYELSVFIMAALFSKILKNVFDNFENQI